MKWYFSMVCTILACSLQAEAIKASSFGFDPADATACLQKAISSGAKKIRIDQTGHEWLIRPIKLAGNQEIIIEKDVTVRAKPGAFKSPYESMLTAESIENLIIRGEPGAVLKMNRKDYWALKNYPHSEWRNLISLRGATNVEIRDLTLEESGGDAIYVASSRKQPMSKNLKFINLNIRNNHRQGISVISAENMLVKKCRFLDTKGTFPQAGIDFEPNSPWQRLINCRVEESHFAGNASSGILLHIVALDQTSEPVSIDIRSCSIANNNGGISIEASGSKPAATGSITIRDCNVTNKKWQTLTLRNLEESGVVISFSNITFDNRGKQPFADRNLNQ